MRLQGKVAFITGGASGLGQAAAKLFAQEGAKIAVADFDEEAGNKTVADICEAGGEALYVYTDVSNAGNVQAAIAATVREFSGLHILYNNAGGVHEHEGSVTDAGDDALWGTLKIDLGGAWLCSKYGIPEIIKSGGGSIINTVSILALIGQKGMDSYTAAKGAIAALTRSMAVEFAPQGIRVNALAPGATKTDPVKHLLANNLLSQSLIDRHLLGLLEPEHIAQAALFLASDASAGITGQILVVDGGATIAAVT